MKRLTKIEEFDNLIWNVKKYIYLQQLKKMNIEQTSKDFKLEIKDRKSLEDC